MTNTAELDASRLVNLRTQYPTVNQHFKPLLIHMLTLKLLLEGERDEMGFYEEKGEVAQAIVALEELFNFVESANQVVKIGNLTKLIHNPAAPVVDSRATTLFSRLEATAKLAQLEQEANNA